jgi:pimeloyl-ACP methyl ester carboxylesterase
VAGRVDQAQPRLVQVLLEDRGQGTDPESEHQHDGGTTEVLYAAPVCWLHYQEKHMSAVVLVHGAWHGAWCWDGVVKALSERGVPAIAVELPLTGFEDDVALTRAAIESAGDHVVVCGHSYGGAVISEAAADLPGVKRLVFIAALMLDSGEDMATLMLGEPSRQRILAERATDVVEWPTDHSPFLSRPAQVAELLASYA